MLTIQQAGLEDLEAISQLFNDYRQFYGQASDMNGVRAFLRDRLERRESVVFLASLGQHDQAISHVGLMQVYPSFSSISMKQIWILNDLFVVSKERKHGVGSALLKRAQCYAQETGAKGLTLQTARSNVNAQRLYESLGWEQDHDFLSYYLESGVCI